MGFMALGFKGLGFGVSGFGIQCFGLWGQGHCNFLKVCKGIRVQNTPTTTPGKVSSSEST